MLADYFQAETRKTMAYPGEVTLPYLTIGLAGEAGEVANKVKKVLRDSREYPSQAELAAIVDELGDCLWYIAQLSGFLGVPLSTVMRLNQEKLRQRKQMNQLVMRGSNG